MADGQDLGHDLWSLHGPTQSTQWSTLMPIDAPAKPSLRDLRQLEDLPSALAPVLAGPAGQGGIVAARPKPITLLDYAQQRLSCTNRAGPLNQPAVLFGLATQQRLLHLQRQQDVFAFGHSPGTRGYLDSQHRGLEAMTVWHGPPIIFLTVTCSANNETWLGTRVAHWAQTNNLPWQIWSASDERTLLVVRHSHDPPPLTDDCWVHRKNAIEDHTCPFHTHCDRVSLQSLAGDFINRDLDPSSLHDLCRIFEQHLGLLLRNVLRTNASRLKLTAWHKMVEFTRAPHAHIICWSERLMTEDLREVLERLQLGHETWSLTDHQLSLVTELAGQLITCTRSTDELKNQFPELTPAQTQDVCHLVETYQIHTCGPTCAMAPDENGNLPDQQCQHWAPWLPSSIRICPRQPQENDGTTFARLELIERALCLVQDSLRETDFPIGPDAHNHTALAQFLRQLFGEPQHADPNDWLWAGVLFVRDAAFGDLWATVSHLPGIPPGQAGIADINILTCYHTMLQLRRQPRVYHKRALSECFVSPYNPLTLAAWKANIQVELIAHTRHALFEYVTKGTSLKATDALLTELDRRGGHRDPAAAQHVRRLTGDEGNFREVPLSEAIYSLDRRLNASSAFPNPSLMVHADLGQDDLPLFTRLKELYANRSFSLESMCFAQFASWFRQTRLHEPLPNNDRPAVPIVFSSYSCRHEPRIEPTAAWDERWHLPVSMDCADQFVDVGSVRRMNEPRPVHEGYSTYAKLVLYLPWRDEDRDLGPFRDEDAATERVSRAAGFLRADGTLYPGPPVGAPGSEHVSDIQSVRSRCLSLFREAIVRGST